MEIIHIILGKANPNRQNGVNKVVNQLATNQVIYGNIVQVWGIANDTINNYEERNFKTVLFQKSKIPFQISSNLKKAILQSKPQTIFHFHGGWIPIFYSIAIFLNKHQYKFVITPHGGYNTIATQKNKLVKKVYFTLFEKKLLSLASKIHCIGKSETVGLLEQFSKSKISLIPYGFEHDVLYKLPRKEELIFGFIGRIDIYTKGLDLLIEAFTIYKQDNGLGKLWIIGDGEDLIKLKQKIPTEMSNHILLLGSKFGNDKLIKLQQISGFVHPSRNEGLPASVLEAASFGIPCIVSEATNIGDNIKKHQAGFVIKNENIPALVNALFQFSKIWKNYKNFTQIQQNAIEMISKNYHWSKICKEFNSNLYT